MNKMEKYLQKYLERMKEKAETMEPDDEGVHYLEIAIYFKSREDSINLIVERNFNFKILEGALVINYMYESTLFEYFIAIDDISYITDEV